MMRQMKTERNPLQRAEGSARWEQGTRPPRPDPNPQPPRCALFATHRRLVPPSLPAALTALPDASIREHSTRSQIDRSSWPRCTARRRRRRARRTSTSSPSRCAGARRSDSKPPPTSTPSARSAARWSRSCSPRSTRASACASSSRSSPRTAPWRCAMNATCHALMDAGVEMFGTLVAATVAIPKSSTATRWRRARTVRGPDRGRGTRRRRGGDVRVLLPRG